MAFYHDVKNNIKILEHIPAARRTAAGAINGTTVDLQGQAITNLSFLISAGTVTTATLDANVQWSDDNSTWTNEATGGANDTAITQLSAAGRARLHVPVPTHRYYRTVGTVGGATPTVDFGVVAVLGGTRHLPISYSAGE